MSDLLAQLREEWYSEPETVPETEDEIIDDELLALEVLFRSRGVTLAGANNVQVDETKTEQPTDPET